MSASKKLLTSVKALAVLVESEGVPLQSKDVAQKIQCNASKLRSLFSLMVRSGILESTQGSSGGFTLKCSPKEVNLQQIYCAIEDRKAFHMDFSIDAPDQERGFDRYFENLFTKLQIEIEDKMKTITLTDIIENIKRNDYGFLEEITH